MYFRPELCMTLYRTRSWNSVAYIHSCLNRSILLLLLLIPQLRGFRSDDWAVFHNPHGDQGFFFEKMVIDPSTTRLYIGAVNFLYDLHSTDLSIRAKTVTGPQDDSDQCKGGRNDSCSAVRHKTNSHTKALAVYDKSSQLIECTSLFQGRCRLRNLHNISESQLESPEPMLANDASSTSVVFIGTGPIRDPVLYVGSTFVKGQLFRDDIPAVTSLSLSRHGESKEFELAQKGLATGTEIRMERKYRSSYRIDYVNGFESGSYAYFATRQGKTLGDDAPIQTRLVRVCTGDIHFYSYTEVPLECSKDDIDYNLLQDLYISTAGYNLAKSLGITEGEEVLYGAFVAGDSSSVRRDLPTQRSAICVYPVRKQVEEVFKVNIMDCYKGQVLKQLPWFKSSDQCKPTLLQWNDVECGKDVNTNIGGGKPITTEPLLTIEDARFTAVAVNTTRGETVAFIGTDDGRLFKTLIHDSSSAEIYATEDVSNNEPILADLEFNESGKYAYVMTPTKIVKMPTSTCEDRASTCISCLSKRDPYCGWCVRNSICTEEETCEKVIPKTASGWLDFQNNLCPNIKAVVPDKIQVTTADFLNVSLENMGDAKGRLKCSFRFLDGKIVDSDPAFPDDRTLRCATPPMNRLPMIPLNSSHLPATLSIVAEGRNTPIASTNFSFYDCNRHTTCSQCAKSDFPCDWCLESNECVAGKLTEDKCRKQHIVNGLNREGHSRRKGPSKCPHIVSPQAKLYVAAGERRNISVKVQNLDPIYMTEFRCEFRMGTTLHEKLAIRTSDDIIMCDEMKFDNYGVGLSGGIAPVGFNVIWSSNETPVQHVLDNIDAVSVEVYKCESLAANCGRCLTLDSSRFDCGWCVLDEQCVRPMACKTRLPGDWLNSTQLCANPTIDEFSPRKGPVGGKTKLRISGSNLGRRYTDVSGAVIVANVQCVVIPTEYEPASEIICETGKAAIKNSKGPIVVRLRADDANYAAVSKLDFEYVEPTVSAVKPDRGPKSGGTDVTIFGTDLDAGSEVRVTFGDVKCEVLSRSTNDIVCRMSASDSDGGKQLHIEFDGSSGRLPYPVTYTFALNPKVININPDHSIVAGGVQIDVTGQGFSLLQRPRMVLVSDRGVKQAGYPCQVKDDQLMICFSPSLPTGDRMPIHPNQPVRENYAFDFDGAITDSRQMRIFSNPTINQFSETRFYRPGDNYLTINGKFLNQGVMERDFKITVGGLDCPLTAMASTVLTCKPPSEKPNLAGGLQPEVVVKIGNISLTAGELSYDSPAVSSGIVMVILACVVAMLMCFVCLAILYRRKTNTHQRQMKYLKTQMDTIEMKVATECKEAFAELQTSLNQYTADLPLGTPIVPFLEYKDYCARVLFPNNPQNHPVLRDLEVDSQKAGAIEAGLREFHKLLMNKTFFLTMVRTMEANKYFLGKDRVYVGSLLMVVLQEKMGYCTEMLKQLLRELIDRTVEKKFQPKILFRRSESIAERMLAAWFTFLMHDYLRNYAGKRLYDLYWGIKQQMEKGPQDALTLDARYSLSEEKLLRATFEYKELMVFIASDSMSYTHQDLPVRVLDCDTITQVKEKCIESKYRTLPYSDRPTAGDLDLEWRTGVNGRMVLQDIDSTSRLEPGGWKRLNTLAHYNVPTNSVLVLSAKQNSLYNLSLLSERSEKSTLSLKNSPTMSRPWGGTTSSSNSKDAEGGYKLFHLVKPSEHGPAENQEKMVTEIYLTRLLMMKGTLQKFINDMLESIFSTSRSAPLPPCIKYMFDFMDEQALEHGITDVEVVHAWKSNALPLRFWVNLIKNPHFIFDIQKPTKVEGCLSVVAQTLMDACSTQDHQLTKDSPSSKLLFAKDMYQYRDWVDSYYSDVNRMPSISDQDMGSLLNEESRLHRGQFHVFSALNELYKYLDQYKEPIMEALESNEHARASRLPGRLQTMKEIEALSDTELRDELRTYSTNFGPITGTTRSVYEKKLAKLRKEGSKITVQTAPAKRTTSKSPARAPVAHFSSPIKSQKQISSRRKATRSESEDESDSELSHVNAYTAPVKTKPITSTPEREYNPSNPVTPKSDVKTIKTITERRMTTSLPANDSVIGLRTELSSLKSDQPGATPPRKTAQPRTPPRSTRVTTTAYSLSGSTSSTRNKTSLLDRGQTIGSHRILDLGNTTGEEEDEDEGQETSRIIYNTNITGKEKRSPIRKAWDKLLGFDFKAGAVPGTKYEMRHGSTRTKVERDLRTGRIRVQQQSVGRDVSTVLMITLAIFLCLLAVAYLGTARQEVIAATTTAFTGAIKDTVQFFYKYAVLPTFIIFGAAVLVLSIYYGHKKWQLMKEKEEAEFYDLVDRILDIIRESALDGEEYISVPHVRDLMFTPAKRRGAELARWERAVDFINANESRVATETRVMRGGQECAVWKWLPSKKTGWQGSAFSSAFSASPLVSPLSSNIPTEALTRCLKVREMFTKDEDDDVDVNAIERAIKEKVYPVRPVHVSVDTTSNDGVVFMKLANKDDAKQSFTALHGVWFNGRLVSVKYMRDKRYAERFPSTAHL